MRLALLHYSVPPIIGGVESVLMHHAQQMLAAGHRVRLIAARGQRGNQQLGLARVPLADSLHPDILAAKAELDAGRVPPQFDALVAQLSAALRKAAAGVDVLFAHNVCSLHKNLALTAALHQLNSISGFPRVILWHHDLAWTTPRYRAELHDGYPWDLLRTDWPGVTQVTVSALRQRELAELLNLAPERIRVVPNGLDLGELFKLEAQTQMFISRFDLLNAAPLLLLPVRLTPRKNIELALHTLAALRADFPAAHLLVTGPPGAHNPANGEYFARLLELRAQLKLTDAAHFLAELSDAYVPDAVIADFYHLADALFLPSREEGFGLPVLEAAASHLPVFCADIPPLRELGNNEVVYFSPDGDPAQVARVVAQSFQSNPVFRLAARTRQNFTWEQIYRQHIAPLL
jgi:mannosylglucosylglycerate synthase